MLIDYRNDLENGHIWLLTQHVVKQTGYLLFITELPPMPRVTNLSSSRKRHKRGIDAAVY
jgi:hypothetical protein